MANRNSPKSPGRRQRVKIGAIAALMAGLVLLGLIFYLVYPKLIFTKFDAHVTCYKLDGRQYCDGGRGWLW